MKSLDKLLITYAKSIVDNINTAIFWVCIILLTPFILYFSIFNGSLSHSSSDWAAFGSFIGGLVGPILTFITILVLVANLHESRKVSKMNKELVDIAKETATINQDTAEISKRTADLAERQFQHNTLDNKIKTTINLTETLSNYLNEKIFTADDVNWLITDDNHKVQEDYRCSFYEMCNYWSKYIFESVKNIIDISIYFDDNYDIDEIENENINNIACIFDMNFPDKLKIYPEIIKLIKDIENHDYSLSIIPKTMFISIIKGDARYWLYKLIIEDKDCNLKDYIQLEWNDYNFYPTDILAISSILSDAKMSQ